MTAVFMSLLAASATAANFVTATPTAPHRGVWQIELSLDAPGGNPFFDVELHFIFTLSGGAFAGSIRAPGNGTRTPSAKKSAAATRAISNRLFPATPCCS
jgi:hypothetical protein